MKITSGERGRSLTLDVLCECQLTIPAHVIFTRAKLKERLMFNLPAESKAVSQRHGWINGDILLTWLKASEAFAVFARQSCSAHSKWLQQSSRSSGHPVLPEITKCICCELHHTTLDRAFLKPYEGSCSKATSPN
jgi:hypothetical protein